MKVMFRRHYKRIKLPNYILVKHKNQPFGGVILAKIHAMRVDFVLLYRLIAYQIQTS